jgi:hypothetical protein
MANRAAAAVAIPIPSLLITTNIINISLVADAMPSKGSAAIQGAIQVLSVTATVVISTVVVEIMLGNVVVAGAVMLSTMVAGAEAFLRDNSALAKGESGLIFTSLPARVFVCICVYEYACMFCICSFELCSYQGVRTKFDEL